MTFLLLERDLFVSQPKVFQCGRTSGSMIHQDDWCPYAVLERLPDEEYSFEFHPSSGSLDYKQLVSLQVYRAPDEHLFAFNPYLCERLATQLFNLVSSTATTCL